MSELHLVYACANRIAHEAHIPRGDLALGSRAAMLKNSSAKYLKDTKQLSWDVMVRKYAPAAAVSLVVLVMFYLRFGLIFI